MISTHHKTDSKMIFYNLLGDTFYATNVENGKDVQYNFSLKLELEFM